MGELLREHTPALRKRIVWILGPERDVDDVLQATLVAAIRAFPRYRGEATVKTWLMGIAVHKVKDHLRHPGAARRAPLELVPDTGEPADPGPSPEARVHSRRQLERLYDHLDALSVDQRVAFSLHVLEGASIAEVAGLVGATPTATKVRVFRARRALIARVRKDPALRPLLEEGAR